MTLTNILSGVLILLQVITLLLMRSAGKRAGTTYQPMMLFMLAGLVLTVNQTFGSGKLFGININVDLQTLMAAIFVTWQARRWQVFQRPLVFWAVISMFILSWVAGYLFMEQRNNNSSLFLIVSSFGITLMAIEMINRNLPQSRVPFHRNTIFLFSVGLLIYYSLLSLLELYSFSFSLSSPGSPFNTHYFDGTIRIFVQLIFIRSVLCIPAKDNYYSY
jgi:hypothetical protein